jgi:urease accessory protein
VLLGRRALWLVPVAFIGVMALSAAFGIAGVSLPYTEIVIGLSVVVLGLAIALRLNIPTLAAMALVGAFAIFHGHAHGSEMPQAASGSAYAAGFMLATALLHLAGVTAGILAARLADHGGWRVVQVGSGAMMVAGVAILARLL